MAHLKISGINLVVKTRRRNRLYQLCHNHCRFKSKLIAVALVVVVPFLKLF